MDIDSEGPEGQIASSPPNFDVGDLGLSENVNLPKVYPREPLLDTRYTSVEPSSDPLSKGALFTSLSQRSRVPEAATLH